MENGYCNTFGDMLNNDLLCVKMTVYSNSSTTIDNTLLYFRAIMEYKRRYFEEKKCVDELKRRYHQLINKLDLQHW